MNAEPKATVTGSVVAATAVAPPYAGNDNDVSTAPPAVNDNALMSDPNGDDTVMGMHKDEMAWMATEGGLMMAGPVGMAASGLASIGGADAAANHRMHDMVDQYRDQIAAVTGKPPGLVTLRDLEQVAHDDPRFAKLVEAVTKDQEARPVGAMAGLGGFVAGQAAIPIPLVGGIIGAMAADAGTNKLMGNDQENTVDGAIQAIANKVSAGELVTTADVFNVRLLQDGAAAERVRNDHVSGKPFAKMSYSAQLQVMQDPEYRMLADSAHYDALAIQNGGNPMDMIIGRVAPANGQFTGALQAAQEGGTRPKSFADMLLNQVDAPQVKL